MHFVYLEALTVLVNNLINTFLIDQNIILYHDFSLNIYECG